MKTTEEINAEVARYRANPIWDTDFSKPLSQIIEEARRKIERIRGNLTDITYGYPAWKERVEPVIGLLTCGLVTLYTYNQEITKWEIAKEDSERGKSLMFRPRGIGSDYCECFICGGSKGLVSNIAAFTDSKETGEEIIRWFGGKARLDFREWEPNWIQVKVGACTKHFPNLEKLYEQTSKNHGLIREIDIKEAKDTL